MTRDRELARLLRQKRPEQFGPADPFAGWLSMQPDPDPLTVEEAPPKPSYTRTRLPGCGVLAVLAVLLAWVAW